MRIELPKFEKVTENYQKKPDIEIFATIPKKTAAFEVLTRLKKTRLIGITGIVSVFLLLLFHTLNKWLAYGTALIFVVFFAFIARQAIDEIKRLSYEYGIK